MLCFILITNDAIAQKYFTRSGTISFSSKTPIEDIEATNTNSTIVIDFSSGRIEAAVLIKGFNFRKALMEEHFNENYMESSKYPKAIFTGRLSDLEQLNIEKDGDYKGTAIGSMSIHGVTNDIEVPYTISVTSGELSAISTFQIEVADYNIKIPAVVRSNIAKTIEININSQLSLLQ